MVVALLASFLYTYTPHKTTSTVSGQEVLSQTNANLFKAWSTSNEIDRGGAFTLEFKADGTVRFVGGGEIKGFTENDSWQSFVKDGVTYITITRTKESRTFAPKKYKIITLTSSQMQLYDEDTGWVLTFTSL